MIKLIDITSEDEFFNIQHINSYTMEKFAAEYSDELKSFISNIEAEPNRYYLLVNALGSGEYYGNNRNGDFFPETALREYHKTFETNAQVYKHHKNKPKLGHRSYGEVLFSYYNSKMHRVELIIALDTDAAPDLKEKIDRGEYPPLSMGARVPYDECSICGNKAKKIVDYCDHLKYQMNRTLSDGRKVFAYNRHPKFFDISFVLIPADRTAYTMAKVASVQTQLSAELGEDYMKEAGIKEADIVKKIEGGKIEAVSKDPHGLIYDSQPEMPKEMIREMTSQYPLSKILSTLFGMQIVPKRRDFQRIVLYSQGKGDLSDQYDNEGALFSTPENSTHPIPEDINFDNFCPNIASAVRGRQHYIQRAPMSKPIIIARIIEKTAGHQEGSWKEQHGFADEPKNPKVVFKNPVIPLSIVGSLYYSAIKAGKSMGVGNISKFDKTLLKHPWLLPLMIGGASLGTVGLQKALIKEGAFNPAPLTRMFVGIPGTYLYSGLQEQKKREGKRLSSYQELVRKHPLVTGLVHTYLAGKVLKHVGQAEKLASLQNNIFENLSLENIDKLYSSIINY